MLKNAKRYQSGWSLKSILLALAGLVVVILIVAFGLPQLLQSFNNNNNHNNANSQQGTNPSSGSVIQQPGTGSNPPANKGSGGGYSEAFLQTVKQNIAQGLHLSVDQVTSQVSGGKQITDVATEQGISADQLHTIELNAYQAAFDQAVQQGVYTQSQASGYMANYRQRDSSRLNDNVTFLFGGSPSVPPPGQ